MIPLAIYFRSSSFRQRWLLQIWRRRTRSSFCCYLLLIVILIAYIVWNTSGRLALLRAVSNYRNRELLSVSKLNNSTSHLHRFYKHVKHILLWTAWFGNKSWIDLVNLSVGGLVLVVRTANITNPDSPACIVTTDRSRLHSASGIVFHALDIRRADIPPIRYTWQRFIFFNMEPPENIHNVIDWEYMSTFGFNWTMSYSAASDVFVPYWKIVKVQDQILQDPRFTAGITQQIGYFTDNFSTRKADAFWVVSHCRTEGNREAIVSQLLKLGMTIDVYGRCTGSDFDINLNTFGDIFMANYRFYLSFENSICDNYTTEKTERGLITSQRHGLIPIVYGGADYKTIMPPNSYIDLQDFSSLAEFVRYIKFLSAPENKESVREFFQWQYMYITEGTPFLLDAVISVCDKLWLVDKNEQSQSYSYLSSSTFSNCTLPDQQSSRYITKTPIYFYSFYSTLTNLKICVVYHPIIFTVIIIFIAGCLAKFIYTMWLTRKRSL